MNNQKGFGTVEGLLALIVVGLIVGVGLFVWHKQNNKVANNTANQTQNNTSEVVAFTDCHSEVDKVKKVEGATVEQYEWTTIEHSKVVLSDWNISLTLPSNMVGKAVCRYTSNGYEFSTKAVVDDDKCVTYYRTQELASEGLEVWRYPASTAAEGQISAASGTLEDYYQAHKVVNSNYFTDPIAGRKYYKVGESFYVAFGDAKGVLDKYKAARTTACKNEQPDFTQPFVEAMTTLKTQ